MKNIRKSIRLSRKNSEWFCSSKSNLTPKNDEREYEEDEELEEYKVSQKEKSTIRNAKERRSY